MTRKSYDIIPSEDTVFILIKGKDIHSLTDLLEIFSQSLQFPEYFGNNLDALCDMLTDLQWLPYQHIIVIIKNDIPYFENDKDIKEELLEIFRLADEEQMENKKIQLCFEDLADK